MNSTTPSKEEPMIHAHSSTPSQRVHWVSHVQAHSGSYGAVSHLSQMIGVSRQTLYRWKATGQAALEQALRPVSTPARTESNGQIERAILTLLVEGHASYRGIQRCLWVLLGGQVSVGKIAAVGREGGQGGHAAVVARQAAGLAAGKRPRGKCPQTDVAAHAADLAQAQYACEGLRYLAGELRHLLGVVVLTAQGVMPSCVRQGELEALLALLDELSQVAPEAMQHELVRLVTLLGAALPQLVLFAPGLDPVQDQACQALGPSALHLLGWAWQRRAILGPTTKELLDSVPADWRPVAAPLLAAWEAAVRASSAVENWHSVLRPYLAVHRRLSSGMVALLAVWHNHRIAERGLHRGQSPLMRSGMTQASPDWLVALGYPPYGGVYSPVPLVDSQPTLALAT